jgi:ABC-2 type transport system permease protein
VSALAAAVGEAGKLPAFVRRDLLLALSHRKAILRDLALLGAQLVVFWFIGRLVDPDALPAYGGSPAPYPEFVAIGIVLSLVVGRVLGRVATAIREEQLRGRLGTLLATSSALRTVQLGSVVLDLLWLPLRMALFLTVAAVALGLDFDLAGAPMVAVLLIALLPFVWGLGLACAAAILAFQRGIATTGYVVAVLGVVSGAYFPLSLLPDWLESVGRLNPLAGTLEGMRDALLGGAGWDAVGSDMLALLPGSAALLLAGAAAFSVAVVHARRNGTLAP